MSASNATKSALEAGERLISVVEYGNLDDLHQVFSTDAEIWHNTDDLVIGVDQTIRNIAAIKAIATEFEYRDVRRLPTPSGFVQQHVLYMKMPDGQEIHDRCCSVAHVKNGRIVRFDAYHDSAAAPRIPGRSGKNWRTQ